MSMHGFKGGSIRIQSIHDRRRLKIHHAWHDVLSQKLPFRTARAESNLELPTPNVISHWIVVSWLSAEATCMRHLCTYHKRIIR
jgi:hypothetical protein